MTRSSGRRSGHLDRRPYPSERLSAATAERRQCDYVTVLPACLKDSPPAAVHQWLPEPDAAVHERYPLVTTRRRQAGDSACVGGTLPIERKVREASRPAVHQIPRRVPGSGHARYRRRPYPDSQLSADPSLAENAPSWNRRQAVTRAGQPAACQARTTMPNRQQIPERCLPTLDCPPC